MLIRCLGPVEDDNHRKQEPAKSIEPPKAGVKPNYVTFSMRNTARYGKTMHIPMGKAIEPALNITSVLASEALETEVS